MTSSLNITVFKTAGTLLNMTENHSSIYMNKNLSAEVYSNLEILFRYIKYTYIHLKNFKKLLIFGESKNFFFETQKILKNYKNQKNKKIFLFLQ